MGKKVMGARGGLGRGFGRVLCLFAMRLMRCGLARKRRWLLKGIGIRIEILRWRRQLIDPGR